MKQNKFTLFDFEGDKKDLISFQKELEKLEIKSDIKDNLITVKCLNFNEEGKMFELKENFNIGWIN